MPPSGADSAIFKDSNSLCVHLEKGFAVCYLSGSSFLWTTVHFSVCFITRIFFSFCLFNDAGFILCFDLNMTGKDIWNLSYIYGIIANTWTSHCPTKENIPHVNDTVVYMRAKECFLKWIHYKRKPLSTLFLRHFEISHLRSVMTTFFRVHLPPQTLFFFHQFLPLSAFLSSFSEECFGAVSVWGFWCFTELLWKKKQLFFCSMSWTKIEGEGRRRRRK